jgi:transposase
MTETATPLANDVILLQELITSLQKTNALLNQENKRLNDIVKSLLDHRFGRKSQKMPPGQYSLFDEPSIKEAEEDLDSADEQLTIPQHQRKKPGRGPLPKDLPRKIVIHDIPEADKICGCGCTMDQIGEETSEQLGIIPAKIYVIKHVRPKYACKLCQEGVKIALVPKLPIPRSIASPNLLANILVSKYEDHLPLYRQEKMWQRIGVDIPRATMSNWVFKCATLFIPLLTLLKKAIMSSDYAKADETPVTVLERDGLRGSFKGYMWVFTTGTPENKAVVFEYHPSREGKVAKDFLEGFKGVLQTDGYYGYNHFRGQEDVKSAGCMQHCRGKFVEVIKIANQKRTGAADMAVKFIQKLYVIEEHAKKNKLSTDEIYELRQEKSKPICDEFKVWLDDTRPRVPPESKLGEAITYAVNQWEMLILYLSDGKIEIDNNSTERLIKPFALGRRNWLFSGNEEGAEASAGIYSLRATCEVNDVEIYDYFCYVLTKIPYAETENDFLALLPYNCKEEVIKFRQNNYELTDNSS